MTLIGPIHIFDYSDSHNDLLYTIQPSHHKFVGFDCRNIFGVFQNGDVVDDKWSVEAKSLLLGFVKKINLPIRLVPVFKRSFVSFK